MNTKNLSLNTLFLITSISIITIVLLVITLYLFAYPSSQLVTAISLSQFQSSQNFKNIALNITSNHSNTIFNLQTPILNSIFDSTEKSIVQITRKVPASWTYQSPSPYPSSPSTNPKDNQNVTILGSGFVYDTQGHIITNYHVVGNAKTVDITFINGNRYTAKVVGKDPLSDLAVLKIIENSTNLLVPLSIANSTSIKVGDNVIAIGNPYGLDNTMTTGIVSQTGRLIEEPSGISITDIIQTDAAINPGNSGGPLLNIKGQVIGINTAKGSEGEGFAVSSNTIIKETPILLQMRNFTHSYLGINGTTWNPDLTAQFKNIPKTLRGVHVNTLTKDGPADKAGLHGVAIDYYGQKHGGDIITSINNQNITEMDQIVTYIDKHTKPGDIITLTVYRGGQYIELKANLSSRPLSFPSSIMPL